MEIEDLDIFSTLSTGILALISGMVIIATITYFIYAIYPLSDSRGMVFFFSLLAFVLGIFIPIFFFFEALTEGFDILGKFLSGLALAILVWIGYHAVSHDFINGVELVIYIVIPSILTIVTSLFITRGVIISLIEEGEFGEGGWGPSEWEGPEEWEEEEEFEGEYEEGYGERGASSVEDRFEEREEEDLFPEEEDESW